MFNLKRKQGYKYTEEFGYIPKDWICGKIKNFTSVVTGGTPSTTHKEYWNGNIKWMSSGELNNKRIFDVKQRITETGLTNSSTHIIPQHCILIGLAGQGKTRGTTAINYVELCTNQSIGAILPSNNFISEYLYQHIDSRYTELRMLSTGDGGRGGLNKYLIENMPILLPPLPEQEKIAEVLSNIDELISSTQKLIDKKKNLKTAVMQNLLTPKVHWKNELFKDIAEMNSGGTPLSSNDSYYGGEIPFLSINDLTTQGKYLKKTEKKITEQGLNNSSARIVKKGNLLYAMYATIGKCSIANIDVAISQAVLGIIVNSKILETEYLYYYLTNIEDTVKNLGQTGTQSNLSKQLISQFNIAFPSLEEQQQIAQTLSDMDFEIEILEQELNKYKDLKTGMMQELLTGKTRLV